MLGLKINKARKSIAFSTLSLNMEKYNSRQESSVYDPDLIDEIMDRPSRPITKMSNVEPYIMICQDEKLSESQLNHLSRQWELYDAFIKELEFLDYKLKLYHSNKTNVVSRKNDSKPFDKRREPKPFFPSKLPAVNEPVVALMQNINVDNLVNSYKESHSPISNLASTVKDKSFKNILNDKNNLQTDDHTDDTKDIEHTTSGQSIRKYKKWNFLKKKLKHNNASQGSVQSTKIKITKSLTSPIKNKPVTSYNNSQPNIQDNEKTNKVFLEKNLSETKTNNANQKEQTNTSNLTQAKPIINTYTDVIRYFYGCREDPNIANNQNNLANKLSDNVSLKCHKCSTVFTDNIAGMIHILKHYKAAYESMCRDEHRCKYCFRAFDSSHDKQCHEVKVHNAHFNPENACLFCELHFANFHELRIHMMGSNGTDKHKKDDSNSSFDVTEEDENEGFKNEKKSGYHDVQEMPFWCQLCEFQSSSYADTIRHFSQLHKGTLFLLCPFCLVIVKLPRPTSTVLHSSAGGSGPMITSLEVYGNHVARHVTKSKSHPDETDLLAGREVVSTQIACPRCRLNFCHVDQQAKHVTKHHGANGGGGDVPLALFNNGTSVANGKINTGSKDFFTQKEVQILIERTNGIEMPLKLLDFWALLARYNPEAWTAEENLPYSNTRIIRKPKIDPDAFILTTNKKSIANSLKDEKATTGETDIQTPPITALSRKSNTQTGKIYNNRQSTTFYTPKVAPTKQFLITPASSHKKILNISKTVVTPISKSSTKLPMNNNPINNNIAKVNNTTLDKKKHETSVSFSKLSQTLPTKFDIKSEIIVGLRCLECNKLIRTTEHFKKRKRCKLCLYSTCCYRALDKHQKDIPLHSLNPEYPNVTIVMAAQQKFNLPNKNFVNIKSKIKTTLSSVTKLQRKENTSNKTNNIPHYMTYYQCTHCKMCFKSVLSILFHLSDDRIACYNDYTKCKIIHCDSNSKHNSSNTEKDLVVNGLNEEIDKFFMSQNSDDIKQYEIPNFSATEVGYQNKKRLLNQDNADNKTLFETSEMTSPMGEDKISPVVKKIKLEFDPTSTAVLDLENLTETPTTFTLSTEEA